MNRKYETRCWFCHSTNIKPDERGMVCYDCGATYNLVHGPGEPPFKGEGCHVSAKGGRPI